MTENEAYQPEIGDTVYLDGETPASVLGIGEGPKEGTSMILLPTGDIAWVSNDRLTPWIFEINGEEE